MSKRHAARRSDLSVVARIEEVVLAASGADAFELVFSLVAARLAGRERTGRGRGGGRATPSGILERGAIARDLKEVARRWPGLEVSSALDVPDAVLASVGSLLDRMRLEGDAEALDAVFEQLVTRVGKGDKGQFFTPRYVVDWIARALLFRPGEKVIDPACGSGAFLAHARAQAAVETWGFDVDGRAVRVARLLAIASGDDPTRIVRGDSLRRDPSYLDRALGPNGAARDADAILTNPPFAGDVAYEGYELARPGRRTERDALFVERCIEMLRPGGRLAIVLPHNKVAGEAWGSLREWLVERARVHAVVSLPRETFLPHTSQKTVVLFARRREKGERAKRREEEPVLFAVSERAGKDTGGEAVFRAGARGKSWRDVDHDLEAIGEELVPFLKAQGFVGQVGKGTARRPPDERRGKTGSAASVIRTLAELGDGVPLAPERQWATRLAGGDGVALSTLVVERADRVVDDDLARAVVFDTTHARDGLLDVRGALRAVAAPASAKKLVRPGDLLVSRLRPYLRQIAFAHAELAAECGERRMACSTEFYVLAPRVPGESLAFLLPWLLGADAQAFLAAAQEGGHHPRVPRETLLALRVPAARVRARVDVSARVERGIADLLKARRGLSRLMEE
jgi:type I restriction enzyme M protein